MKLYRVGIRFSCDYPQSSGKTCPEDHCRHLLVHSDSPDSAREISRTKVIKDTADCNNHRNFRWDYITEETNPIIEHI